MKLRKLLRKNTQAHPQAYKPEPKALPKSKQLLRRTRKKRLNLSTPTSEAKVRKTTPNQRNGKKLTHHDIVAAAPKLRDMYPKAKCAHYDIDGVRCTRNAVGKSSLCEIHGGARVVPENLLSDQDVMTSLLNTKFEPSIHPMEYILHARQGRSNTEIAAFFEVSVGTLQKWSETYESFNAAYDIGQALYEAWWLNEGKENLKNIRYNTSMFKFLTGNKLGYSDKVDTKSTSTNLHGVLLIPGRPDQKGWEENVETIIGSQSGS